MCEALISPAWLAVFLLPSFSPPFPQCGKCINAFISPRLPGILCTLLYLIVCKDLGGRVVFLLLQTLKKKFLKQSQTYKEVESAKDLFSWNIWNAHCSVWDGEASGGKFIFLNQEVVVRIKWVNVYKGKIITPTPSCNSTWKERKLHWTLWCWNWRVQCGSWFSILIDRHKIYVMCIP